MPSLDYSTEAELFDYSTEGELFTSKGRNMRRLPLGSYSVRITPLDGNVGGFPLTPDHISQRLIDIAQTNYRTATTLRSNAMRAHGSRFETAYSAITDIFRESWHGFSLRLRREWAVGQ